MTIELQPPLAGSIDEALRRAATYPRLRYMGSKYRLAPALAAEFARLGGSTALDAFSGSGVVSYLMKAMGFQVTSNDFLSFPGTIARATVENSFHRLDTATVELICGPSLDGRDFIASTFRDRFLSPEDLSFLDSAWSHIDTELTGYERDVAIAALVLSAAKKQPRGVFTFTGTRYDDGRRDLRLSMAEHFRERVADYNSAVFDSGLLHTVLTSDVAELAGRNADIVYLDPPYAPPTDDADYMKRYHFLEGLSVYWRGVEIMEETKTKKIRKMHTPFAHKRTIEDALARTFEQFRDSGAIVLSYSSNAVPDADRILQILRATKPRVELRRISHRYSFGTHATATRREVDELIFVGRD